MNNLPDKPSWEVVITTSQNKRTPSAMSIHIALFKSLWVDQGMEQDTYSEYFMREIHKQENSHGHVAESAAVWLWSILKSENLKMLRFASGKYVDTDLTPHYDEFVDVDVSMVLEKGKVENLIVLIDKMIQFNRKYKKFKEIQDENEIRSIQSKSSGHRSLPS